MAYPKPLSENKLAKLYEDADITEEVKDYLHRFFLACANYYGLITLRDAWNVFQTLKGEKPKLHRSDLEKISTIIRREEQPYYMFEVDELFDAECREIIERHIVHKVFITKGQYKNTFVYMFLKEVRDCPYCVPNDLLSYADNKLVPQEQRLLDFLSDLVSEADLCVPGFGMPYPNENKGKKLGEFSFLTSFERERQEKAKPGSFEDRLIQEALSQSEAEKLFYALRKTINRAFGSPLEDLVFRAEEMKEAGVVFTEASAQTLMNLFEDYNNHVPHWYLKGWSPASVPGGRNVTRPMTVTLGHGRKRWLKDHPEEQKHFAELIQTMGISSVNQ